MSLRRIQLSAVGLVLFTFFFASFAPQPTSEAAVTNTVPTIIVTAPAANWTFSGCWTQFSSGTCRDIYRDQEGQAWICKACGQTGNPGPGKCNPISNTTLNSGFWCS